MAIISVSRIDGCDTLRAVRVGVVRVATPAGAVNPVHAYTNGFCRFWRRFCDGRGGGVVARAWVIPEPRRHVSALLADSGGDSGFDSRRHHQAVARPKCMVRVTGGVHG